MPRTKLTWQPGTSGRAGRWKKKYRGKSYYFAGGCGKSDREAYQAAITEWGSQKQDIDQQTKDVREKAFQAEIDRWDQALTWSRTYGDESMSQVASKRIKLLKEQSFATKPNVPAVEDTFDGYFELEVRDPTRAASYAELAAAAERQMEKHSWHAIEQSIADTLKGARADNADIADSRSHQLSDPTKANSSGSGHARPPGDLLFQDEDELLRRIWHDRITTQQRGRSADSPSIGHQVKSFLSMKRSEVDAGKLSEARHYSLTIHLKEFTIHLGPTSPCAAISGQSLLSYREKLLGQLNQGQRSTSTVKDRLASVRTFVRWLWEVEAISELPRILMQGSSRFMISADEGDSSDAIITFSAEEIWKLFGAAPRRTQLYMLLSLNTAMTQKDISDLKCSEFDAASMRITRKRSKTKRHANVPIVSYQLWPETRSLLEAERSVSGGELLLVNRNGGPLLWEGVVDGKYRKNDNVRSAIARVARQMGLKNPFKSMKKTSATLLRGNREFASVYDFFLGHSAKKIADRHYAKPPQELLDEALEWLGEYYRSRNCFGDE